MVTRNVLETYLSDLLLTGSYKDYCPNGLQVEGKAEINRVITGVTASQALIDAAIEAKADALLVHHGYFWLSEAPCITGMKRRRIQSLLACELNLFAYHLPLDVHLEYGNNVQLAKILGIEKIKTTDAGGIENLLFYGELSSPMSGQAFFDTVKETLKRVPLYIPASKERIQSIAWCTGGAQNYIEKASSLDVDAYLTGEASESTVHVARENNIHFYSAGHHATERYGVQALGEHLAEQFQIEHLFIDIDNPV